MCLCAYVLMLLHLRSIVLSNKPFALSLFSRWLCTFMMVLTCILATLMMSVGLKTVTNSTIIAATQMPRDFHASTVFPCNLARLRLRVHSQPLTCAPRWSGIGMQVARREIKARGANRLAAARTKRLLGLHLEVISSFFCCPHPLQRDAPLLLRFLLGNPRYV